MSDTSVISIDRALQSSAEASAAAEIARGHVMAAIFSDDLCATWSERKRLQGLIHSALDAARASGAATQRHQAAAARMSS